MCPQDDTTDRWGRTRLRVPDPPREIGRWFFWRRMPCLFIFGILFTALPTTMLVLMFFLMGGVSPTIDFALDRLHAKTTGQIVDKTYMRHTHINGRSPWRVRFQFETPGGAVVQTEGYAFDDTLHEKEPGAEIGVEYDPESPVRARPAGGGASLMQGTLLWIVVGVFGPHALVGICCLTGFWLQCRKQRLLLTHGFGAAGEVEHVSQVGMINWNGEHPYDVSYSYLDHQQRSHRGYNRTYRFNWARTLERGDRIDVVYNPHSPGASLLWFDEDAAAPPRP